MSPLARLQSDFLAAILDGQTEAIAGRVRAGRVSPAERLEAYRRNVAGTLRAALAAAYPVVERLVGAAFFTEAAARYARAHPSASGDLHRFGDGFAQFLAAYPHGREVACLADVARLEWAWHECFHAADGGSLDFAALAAVPAARHGEIRFHLHPAVRLVQSPHPVLAIWEANQPGRDGIPARSEWGERVLVHREDYAVRLRAAAADEWSLLAGFARGATLEEAARGCADDLLGGLLRRLAADRVIAGFALGPPSA